MAEFVASYLQLHVQTTNTIHNVIYFVFMLLWSHSIHSLSVCGLAVSLIIFNKQTMEATTEQKQRYLREQIMQNYDPEEFFEFLTEQVKLQELDVQHISMDTLKEVVLKFKQYKYYQSEYSSREESSVVSSPGRGKKVQWEKNTNVSMLYDYEFDEYINCLQVEPFCKDLEVYIPRVDVVQTEGLFLGLGSKTQIWFVIKTSMDKSPVKRLAEDFQWLSNTINKLYPLQAIPELIAPNKQQEGNHQYRRKQLEQYLQILAARAQMRRSHLLFEFLTFPSQKMEKMRKNYDSMSSAKGLHSIKTPTGKIHLSLSNKLRTYVHHTMDYMRKVPKIHEGISESVAKVCELLEETTKEIYKIVDNFAQLHQHYNEVTNKSPQYKINEYSETLININNFFHSFANDLNNRSKILGSNLKEYSKISLNYDKSMFKLYKNFHETEKEYISFKSSLNRKKERIYPEVAKWEVDEKSLENRRINKEEAFQLMLPKETKQEQDMKKWLAYLFTNYKEQFDVYLNYEVKRYCQAYCTFCSQLLLNNKTYVEEMTKFLEETRKLELS